MLLTIYNAKIIIHVYLCPAGFIENSMRYIIIEVFAFFFKHFEYFSPLLCGIQLVLLTFYVHQAHKNFKINVTLSSVVISN